jgi:hypothetical protein
MEMMESHKDFRSGLMAIQVQCAGCFIGFGDLMLLLGGANP